MSTSPSDADQRRAMKAGLSRRMRRVAESRRCPACDRKQALTKVAKLCAGEPQIYVCRYCGHELARGGDDT